MTTFTRQDIAQFLKGSNRVNIERALIVEFFQKITALILRDDRKTEISTLNFDVFFKEQKLGFLKVYRKLFEVPYVWFQRESGSRITHSVSIIGEEASHLRKEEVIAIYDALPGILDELVRRYPTLTTDMQFFFDVADRQ